MLTYFLPDYNNYKIRTQQLPANTAYMRVDVQNMLTNEDYSFLANPGQWSYNECESIVDISFNLDIPLNVNVGDEYRIFFTPGITSSTQPFTYGDPVWHGSLQVFASQSVDKPSYVNQIPLEGRISMDSDNTFIYWDQAAPVVPTTTTTTLAPTTTTIAPTTTTTTLAPTTTTTTTPSGVDLIFFFGSQIGAQGFDVCWSGSNSSGTGIGIEIRELKTFMSSDSACTIPYGTSWDLNPQPRDYFFAGGTMDLGNWGTTSEGTVGDGGTYYRTRISGSFRIDVGGFSPIETFDLTKSQFKDLTHNGKTARILGPNCTLNNHLGCFI